MKFTQFTAARADNGAPLPYARATVYYTGTTTLASLFNASGTPIDNPCTADATGLLQFATPDGTYDMVIVSADGLYSVPPITKFQIVDLINIKDTITSGRLVTSTYSELSALTPANGTVAEVPPSDTGTHTDPVTSATGTPNSGVYRRESGGWRWMYALNSATSIMFDSTRTVAQMISRGFYAGPLSERGPTPFQTYPNGFHYFATDLSPPREFVWVTAGNQDPSGTVVTSNTWYGYYTPAEIKNLAIGFTNFLPQANVAGLADTFGLYDAQTFTVRVSDFRARALNSTSPLAVVMQWSADGNISGFTVGWGGYTTTLGGGVREFRPPVWSQQTRVTAIGDSMMEGKWVEGAAATLGLTLNNVAKYSSGAYQPYRLGTRPLYFTVTGNTIPAGGTGVLITAINGGAPDLNATDDAFSGRRFLNTQAGDTISTNCSVTGWLGGRHGTVSVPNGGTATYTFTPDDGQAASTLAPQTIFIPDNLARLATDELWIRMSQNYIFAGPGNPVFPNDINPRVLDDIQAIVDQARGQRIIILALTPQSDLSSAFKTALLYFNNQLRSRWPQYAAYLTGVTYSGSSFTGNNMDFIRAYGSDGSANDIADIAAGLLPRSCLADNLHLNAKGQGLESQFLQLYRERQAAPPLLTLGTPVTLQASATNPRLSTTSSVSVSTTVVGGAESSLLASTQQTLSQLVVRDADQLPQVGRSGGDGLQSYTGAGNTVPLVTDSTGKMVMGVNLTTGQISADFDLDKFVKTVLTLRTDGLAVYTGTADVVPLVTDAAGRMRLGISLTTGKLSGDFDVSDTILSWIKSNISPGASGLFYYTGSSTPRVPIVTDQTGKILMSFNTVTEKFEFFGGTAGSSVSSYPPTAKTALPNANKFTLAANTIYGVVVYGQSLSLGAQGRPALSTVAPPYANLTFAAGTRTTLNGNGFQGTNQSAMDASKALVEDELTGDSNTTRGETILSGMLNGAVELAAIENVMSPSSLPFFGSCAGHGGWSVSQLSPGYIEAGSTVNWYQNFLDHVTKQRAIALAAGKSYVCVALPWMQLEANSGSSKASYKSAVSALFTQMQNDVVAITGQSVKPHIIVYQTPYGCTASGGGGPHLALLELAQENIDIHVCPVDGLPFYSDGTHMTNYGYLRYGRRLARLLKDIVVDGVKPLWINPRSAVVQGNYVRVKFTVPYPPLVLDTTDLAPTTAMGFRVTSDTGSPNVLDVSIENGDTVLLVLDATPGANAQVRCGLDYLGTGLVISNGATHNLRDSGPATFRKAGVSYPLYNVAPHFTIPAITLDNGA